jgi:hypothetical protein
VACGGASQVQNDEPTRLRQSADGDEAKESRLASRGGARGVGRRGAGRGEREMRLAVELAVEAVAEVADP